LTSSAITAQILELRPEHNWTDYPIGVARELAALEFPIDAANLFVRSTVPEGSGLSSSAALEVASALALLKSRPLDSRELARLCQRAEHNFVGIPCGIMDQYCSLLGHEQAALDLDCRSLEHRLAPLPAGIVFVAVNTTVKHALATSAYQQHVAECTTAARLLRVDSLRDLAPGPFAAMADSLPGAIARRVRHVLTENERVGCFFEACSRGDLVVMGRLMVESHRSLQCDYAVSCPGLDFLVDTARAIDSVYGARMTGGGFGGCAIALLQQEMLPRFRLEIAAAYQRRFRVIPEIYICRASGGAGEVNNFETIPAAA
jgi:galactokinase